MAHYVRGFNHLSADTVLDENVQSSFSADELHLDLSVRDSEHQAISSKEA